MQVNINELVNDLKDPSVFLMKYFGLYPIPLDQPKWGDIFRPYIQKNPEAVNKLISLMDDPLSVDTLNRAIDRLMYLFPPAKYRERHFFQPIPFVSDFEKKHAQRMIQLMPSVEQEFPGFYQGKSPECFYSHHGLRFLNPCVSRYLAGGDFIDCGAYIGDSAVIMQKYHPRKLHVIEPSSVSVEKLKINLAKYAPALNWLGYQYCIGKEPGTVYFNGNMSGGSKITDVQENGTAIPRITIDLLCSEYKIDNIRWIKADLEGEAKNMILGAEKTIKKYKPLLTLAVYHCPEEFFEIAPLLKQWVPEYHFTFRRCSIPLNPSLLYGEETLIAYVPQKDDPVQWYTNEPL